ncbi:MAG: VPDSG-CTERM sorting domain-containing protein [Verrucomicrobiales bacterium]|nr:VPDSG-CTERM sorting domain-containing protein [Verrucomicrobiales bacterium]
MWYSDTDLNGDGLDHMAAYQGMGDTVQIGSYSPGPWEANEYVLAFEDLDDSVSDYDYTDFVVMVESVSPVPDEGMTLTLLGGAMLGLVAFRRRKA